MAPSEQVGAGISCLGRTPLAPGDAARAVIVPLPSTAEHWRTHVSDGDVLVLYDGPRVSGRGQVEWVQETPWPGDSEADERLRRWCEDDAGHEN